MRLDRRRQRLAWGSLVGGVLFAILSVALWYFPRREALLKELEELASCRWQQDRAEPQEQIGGDHPGGTAPEADTSEPGAPHEEPQTDETAPGTSEDPEELPPLPPSVEAYRAALKASEHEEKLQHFRDAVRLASDKGVYQLALIIALKERYGMEESEEALRQYRQEVARLKEIDPDNALGWYLEAKVYFQQGRDDLALRELREGLRKRMASSYAIGRAQLRVDIARSTGKGGFEVFGASMATLLPFLAEFRELGNQVLERAELRQAAGDRSGARELAGMPERMIGQLDQEPQFVIHSLVWIAMRNKQLETLEAMAAENPYLDVGQLAREKRRLELERAEIGSLVQQLPWEAAVPGVTPQDWEDYVDEMLRDGEVAAMRNSTLVRKNAGLQQGD